MNDFLHVAKPDFALGRAVPHAITKFMVATDCSRRHCLFSGRVQGVGFRYRSRNLAISFDVTGFVRNLADGRVELVAEGPAKEVEAFVEAIIDRMKTYIRDCDAAEEPASGEYSQFIISR